MNIDLAVVAEQLANFQTGVKNVIVAFKEFPLAIQNFAEAFTSDAWLSAESSSEK